MIERTRKELDAVFADELRGLLLESFQLAERGKPTDFSASGNMMYQQMIRGQRLLDRIHAFYNQPEVKPAANGQRKEVKT